MPAKKDSSLNKRHSTKVEKQARESAEADMVPITQLTTKPPPALKGHKQAGMIWTRLLTLYDETKGKIITAFDADMLIKYCLAEEELLELFAIRAAVYDTWKIHLKWLNNLKPKGDQISDYLAALQQANALLQRFQGMDARMDGKRKMIITMAQSLYLTPRSRAGVAPEEKPKQKPKSDMDELLD